jgi:hypothetical protein
METFVITYWEIISGLLVVIFLGITWKAEISRRLTMLEEKVKTLFELFNSKK